MLDADVLGRERTGDETYVANLLRSLPAVAPDLRLAAVTRHPALVPEGVEPILLRAGAQEVRMAWSFGRLLRRLRPALGHFQHAIPLGYGGPAVVTVHDLSFERHAGMMPRKDRLLFRLFVPRAARRAARVFVVSERTKRDLAELYGVSGERVVVTLNGVDPAFAPAAADGRATGENGYALFVGAIQQRKNPLAAAAGAAEAGLRLVIAGPPVDRQLARELERRGADLRGYLGKEELADLYRRAACLVLPSRYEGFGLPVVEAMACGTPVVVAPDAALREVAGDAAVYAEPEELGDAIRLALRERPRLVRAGLERARAFSWTETARRVADAYREVIAES